MAAYYPAFLDLRDRPCTVIGGGALAAEKVRGLLEAGARVTVIAPVVADSLAALAEERRIVLHARPYRPGDLRGAFLAIAAGADPDTRAAIWREAGVERVVLNSVDDAAHCHFIAPAIHRRGDLVVAVSTAGKSPALAVRIRDRIADRIGPEYGALLELLGELRSEIASREPDFARRTALWYRLVDLDLDADLRRGDVEGARRRARALLDEVISSVST
ncbi:MAG TPA: bifunctional precorrin-2 dehydrogenase/sirohydrochlorin ferrochelatase [bacterium]|nr:bifunctional precorrin-2 dehydrogenase/sirohydrochlorin ferrochelatase [bacterium]